MGHLGVGRSVLPCMLGLVLVVMLWACCAPAGAFVYWDNYYYAIGRANLDGSGQIPKFESLSGTPCGVASDGRYVYWADHLYGSIGRAPIDGSGPATDGFVTGLNSPCGVAVYDHHLYWANEGNYQVAGSIGRADLTGPLDVRPDFIPDRYSATTYPYNHFCGLDVNASGVYWGDPGSNAIDRANLDGTGAGALISGASSPCGVTLTPGHILWTNGGSGTIGTALLDGTSVDQSYITGQYAPCGLAAYDGELYWSSGSPTFGDGMVNRVALNSPSPTADTETIVMGIANPCGVTVDGLFSGAMKVLSARGGAGGILLSVEVSAPGTVRASQRAPGRKLITSISRAARHSGRVQLRLQLTRAGRWAATTHSADRVKLLVAFRPRGGIPAMRTISVSLH